MRFTELWPRWRAHPCGRATAKVRWPPFNRVAPPQCFEATSQKPLTVAADDCPDRRGVLIAGEGWSLSSARFFSEDRWTVRLTQWRAYLTDQLGAPFSQIFMWWLSHLSASKLYTYNPSSTLPQCLPSNSHRIPFKIGLKVHPIILLLKIQSRDCLTAQRWGWLSPNFAQQPNLLS
jgi:hypothetical protein